MRMVKESGGNTRLYTLRMTRIVKRESEVIEENTKVGDPNYSSVDHSKRPANKLISTSGAKTHTSALASMRIPTPQHFQIPVLSQPLQ